MVDLVSNKIVGEIPLEDVSYERALKQPGSFEGKITVTEQTNALDLYNSTLPGKTALYVVRNNEAVWGGIIWGRTYDLVGRSLAISASEFTSYLNHRIVWKTFSHSYSANLAKVSGSGTPYFLVNINNATLREPYPLTDEFGNPTKVEITFVNNKLRKYSGFYEIRGLASTPAAPADPTKRSFYIQIPKLPAPISGVYPNVGLSAKSDTYSYLRDLLGNVFRDFVDIDFPNDVIEPGIKQAIEVKYMQLTTSNKRNGVAKITTETPHGLVPGQRVELVNLSPMLDGVHTISSVPTTTTFEYVLTNPTAQDDNFSPLYLSNIAADTVPVTERTPVVSRQVLQQTSEYIASLKRVSGYTTIKLNSVHPFTVGQKVTLRIAKQTPVLRAINGKSVNIFDYAKVSNVVQIDSVTDYTIGFTDPIYTTSLYDLKESNVAKPAENSVKNAADRPILQLKTKTNVSLAAGNTNRGYNIGNKVRVVGVDAPDWDYPIYNGYHTLFDTSPGILRPISSYLVTTDVDDSGETYSYAQLIFSGNVGYTEGDFLLVDGITANPQLEGEYQIFYADYNAGLNQTTVRYYKQADPISSTPGGDAVASLNGTSWVIYEPASSETRYSLKSEPDSTFAIASLRFSPATATSKNRVTITTQARHTISVGDVVLVDFGNAEKGKDTKTYGGRVTVTGVGDLDQITYTLSGKRELPIPKTKLDETPKTGVITRKTKTIGTTPVVEARFSALSAERDDNNGTLITAYGVDHDLNAGDYIVVDIDNPELSAFENKNVPTRIESITPNSFSFTADNAASLKPVPASGISELISRKSGTIDIMEVTVTGTTERVLYPEQKAKIKSLDLSRAELGYIGYTYDKVATGTIASGGNIGENIFTLSASNPNIKPGLTVSGTGIPSATRVTAVDGATITVNKAFVGQVSGTITFDVTLNRDYNITITGFTNPTPTIFPAATGSAGISSIYTGINEWGYQTATITFDAPHNLAVTNKIDPLTGQLDYLGDFGAKVTISGMMDYVYEVITYRSKITGRVIASYSSNDLYDDDSIWLGVTMDKKTFTTRLSGFNGTWTVNKVPDNRTVVVDFSGEPMSVGGSGATASWVGTPRYKWPENEANWAFLNMKGDVSSTNTAERRIWVYYSLMIGNADDIIALSGTVDVSSKDIIATFPEFYADETELPVLSAGDFIDFTGFTDPALSVLNKSGPHVVTGTTYVDGNPDTVKVRFRNFLPVIKNVRQTLTWKKTPSTLDNPKLLTPFMSAGVAYLDYSTINDEVARIASITRTSAAPARATVTTTENHGFETGDYVNVWAYGKGLAAFNQKNEPLEVTYISDTQFSYALAAPTRIQFYSVTKKVATLTFNRDSAHNFFIGDTISVSNVATNINGTRTITSVGVASISFAVPNISTNVVKTATKGTLSLSTAITKTVSVQNSQTSSVGQVLQAPTIYREPVVFARTWGEFPGSADIGGLTFSTNEYSGQQSTNSPLYGSALATVADVLDKYSNSLTGFEYRIDVSLGVDETGEKEFKRKFVLIPLYPATLTDYLNSLPDKKLAKGQAADPAAFGADKVIFEYPGNISNISVAESAQNSATRIFVNNKNNKAGEGVESAYSAATAMDLLSEGWPLLDRTETVEWPQATNNINSSGIDKWGNHDDETDFHTSAKRFLQESKPPAGDIVITVNGSLNPVVGTYNPGEWCSIIVRDEFLKNRLGTALEPRKDVFVRRIDAIRVQVPNNPAFPEQIDLTLVPDWQVDRVGE
jgi:hypothetical protein